MPKSEGHLEVDYSKFDERFQSAPEPIPKLLSEKEL